MTDDPMGDRSIEGRAANGEGDDAPELFPLGSLEGDGVTLKTIVKPSEKVETTVAMMSAEVPSSGGLLDPRREGMLLVTYELAQAPLVPKREGGRARCSTGCASAPRRPCSRRRQSSGPVATTTTGPESNGLSRARRPRDEHTQPIGGRCAVRDSTGSAGS
jgi:hypothetical protein